MGDADAQLSSEQPRDGLERGPSTRVSKYPGGSMVRKRLSTASVGSPCSSFSVSPWELDPRLPVPGDSPCELSSIPITRCFNVTWSHWM